MAGPARGADLRAPALLALAIAAGLWPYLGTLGYGPMTLDAVHWIQRGSPGADGWWQWVFGGAHFIGYRPLNALSFAVTGLGDGAGIHRAAGLLLHAASAVLVWAVARCIPELPRWGAWIALGVFLAHPAAEEVVPWIARRHYELATTFSLAALLCVSRGHRFAAALCLAAGLLSNEIAFTTAAFLPAWAWLCAPAAPGRWRGALRVALPALVAAVAVLVVRTAIVGGLGGYSPGEGAGRALAVVAAFWRDLLAFVPRERSGASRALLLAAAVGFAVCGLHALRAARAGRPAAAALLAWLAGASALLSLQGVWFARELLPLLPAFALFLATISAELARGARAWLLAPLAVAIALAGHSPLLHGPDPVRIARWQDTQAVLDEVGAALERAREPTWIGLALAHREDEARQGPLRARELRGKPPRWLRLAPAWLGPRYADRGHVVETLLGFPESATQPADVRVEGNLLRLPGGARVERLTPEDPVEQAPDGSQRIRLAALSRPAGLAAFVYLRTAGAGRLVPLSGATSEAAPENVVLIVIDTLRRDHVGAYGYSRDTTPHIDRLAAESVRYARAWSQAPWTTPSVAALLTSRLPQELGIQGADSTLPARAVLLSERLAEAGWRTGGVVSHRFVSRRWGFAQGFEHFDDSQAKGHDAVTSAEVTARALAFLDAHAREPFFLFLHYFDPHFAYLEHEGFRFERIAPYAGPVTPDVRFGALLRMQTSLEPADAGKLVRLYDSEIRYTDAQVGRVLEHLRTLGIDSRTLVVLTADHGEEFLDHGRLGHTKTLYDEVVAVPLLVRRPGAAPGVVDAPVALLDVAPTLLAALGLPADPQAAGRVLPAVGEPGDPERVVLTATHRRQPKRAAIAGGLKLIESPAGLELYDLADDPAERHDLGAARPDERARLERALAGLPEPSGGEQLDLSEDERERLRLLGYGVD